MARPRKKRRSDPLLSQALLETKVRYGPEEAGLVELLRQARSDLRGGIAAETGAARGIRAAANAARPQIKRAYQSVGKTAAQAESDLRTDLSKLSAAADPYKAITAREVQGNKVRLAEGLTGALNELTSRGVQAEEGRAFATRNLQSRYADEKGQIKRRRLSLAGEKGAFTVSRYGDLVGSEKERRIKIRGQDITLRTKAEDQRLKREEMAETRRHNVRGEDISERKADKKDKPKGPGEGRKSEHRKVLRQLENAIDTYRSFPKKVPRQARLRFMTAGKTEGNPEGGFDNVIARAAADYLRAGYIGPYNARRLKSVGLWKVPSRYRNKPRKPKPKSVSGKLFGIGP